MHKKISSIAYFANIVNSKLAASTSEDITPKLWETTFFPAKYTAKDTIIELNKTRIEVVKDGIQKEIDAYEKLINKRKEDLSAQKDQHDWAKTVKEHTAEIDSIQRKLDALNGDTSASAAAQRKKLQEELANAQQELEETYYDHEIEMQQKALDETLELYKEDKEIELNEKKMQNQLLQEQIKSISFKITRLSSTDFVTTNYKSTVSSPKRKY